MKAFHNIFSNIKKPIGPDKVLKILKARDIFIDCGANIGQETIPAAKQGVEVYAFEPNPYAFKYLEDRVGDLENVHLFNKAVWDRYGELKLFLHKDSDSNEVKWSSGSSIIESKNNVDKNKFVQVEVIDIIEFIRNLDKRVKLLKIDIEGAEFEVLQKLIMTENYKKVDYIFVETHEKKIPELLTKKKEIDRIIKLNNIKNIYLNWL